MPRNPPTVWTSHLKKENKASFQKSLRNWINDPVTQRFLQILEQKKQGLQNLEAPSYQDAAWAFKQAHNNGSNDILKTLEDLFNWSKH